MTEKYRPSNGIEGLAFEERFCDRCTLDNLNPDTGDGGCSILSSAQIFNIDDTDFPKEWVYDEAGEPTCTAFTTEPLPTKADLAYLEWQKANPRSDNKGER